MAKKIINNRMYNTETAKQLGYWSNGYTPSDFYFAEERLLSTLLLCQIAIKKNFCKKKRLPIDSLFCYDLDYSSTSPNKAI